jgi:hypothetical protein
MPLSLVATDVAPVPISEDPLSIMMFPLTLSAVEPLTRATHPPAVELVL